MAQEDFIRGEAKAKLENITENVSEIKAEMKEHNASDRREFATIKSKIDEVSESARRAATLAETAAQKVTSQETVNDSRHKGNREHLERIEAKVDKLNNKVTTIYGVATGIGLVSGFAATWLKDLIMPQ